MGIFGNMFDLNHDGKMSPLEKAVEFSFLETIIADEKEGEDDGDTEEDR